MFVILGYSFWEGLAQIFMGRRTQTLLTPQCMMDIHRQLKSNQLKTKQHINTQYRVTEPSVNVQSNVTEPSITEARYPKRVWINHQ